MLVCRLATKDDIAAVSQLRMEYLKEAYCDVTDEEYRSLLATNLEYLKEHLGKDCFVSLTEGEEGLVSCAYMNLYSRAANRRMPNNIYAEVYGVYTLPSHRRKRLASRNMELVLEAAREHGAAFVQLDASPDGIHLYRKLGFIDSNGGYVSMKLVF